MEITTSNQLTVFLYCFAGGVVSGLFFDFFRIIRLCFNVGTKTTAVFDLIYWLGTAFLFFFSVLISNSGEVRLFEFFACFVGIILYFLTLSRFITGLSVKITEFILKVIRFLLIPVVWILRLVKKPVFIVLGGGRRTFRHIKFNIARKIDICKKFVTKI